MCFFFLCCAFMCDLFIPFAEGNHWFLGSSANSSVLSLILLLEKTSAVSASLPNKKS